MEASNRLKQAQHFSTHRKVLMETPESIRTSLTPGEWVPSIDLSDAYLPPPPPPPIHPYSRKYLRFCLRSQVFSSPPFISPHISELKPTQVFFVCGLRIPSRFSPCKTHSREMAQLQDLILRLKSKLVLTARCLMSLIGLLASTKKRVPEGRLHMRPFQFHLKEHWRYPQSLDSLLPWTEAIAAHLDR